MSLKNLPLAVICFAFLSFYGHSQDGKVTVNQDKRITELLNLKKENWLKKVRRNLKTNF